MRTNAEKEFYGRKCLANPKVMGSEMVTDILDQRLHKMASITNNESEEAKVVFPRRTEDILNAT
jgi:hypothetical protein